MFEKEAEEIAKDIYIHHFDDSVIYPNVLKAITVGVQKGAEFGYNKAKEDADKMKSRFLELCNLKDMRIEELEKANEWHYVKDGDYPKENKKYWVLTSDRGPKVDSWLNISWVNSYDVIAWKEIVLPKEIKDE